MKRGAVVALLAIAPASASVTPKIPTSYYVEATMTMPYYDLVEPITAYYCEDCGLGRLDYWGGVERYLYNASGPAYQIVPTSEDGITSAETCFVSGEKYEPVSLFPDLTNFPTTPDDGECELNGVACASFTLRSPTYDDDTGFDGNYTLYVDASDGTPLRFHFTGFNVILGSHYDEYIFDYLKVIDSLDGVADATTFAAPARMECVILETDDDDGGGPTKEAGGTKKLGPSLKNRPKPDLSLPLEEIRSFMPGGRSGRSARFEAWAKKHEKPYLHKLFSKEAAHRHELFHRASMHGAADMFVNAMNRRRLPYWLEANHMADWTREEKQARAKGRLHTPKGTTVPATKTHETGEGAFAGGALPDEVDWRAKGAVTPPKDQGTCGSCWSYGATGTTEGQLFLKTGVLTPLSQQNLMDCSWPEGNHACDGGLDFRAYEWMISHGGIATESSYPYLNADGYCRFTSSTIGATITGYANITDGVSGLNDALANVGPISVSIDATPDSFYFYQGGLYYNADCKSGMDDLDHTVLAVGYTTVDGQIYSIVKNSWSDHWGDGGYVYISQQDNCCGVATQPTYVML